MLIFSIIILIILTINILVLGNTSRAFKPKIRVQKYADGTYQVEYSIMHPHSGRIIWVEEGDQTSSQRQVTINIQKAHVSMKRELERNMQEYKHNHVVKTREIK